MDDEQLMQLAVKAAIASGMKITIHPFESIDPFSEGVDYLLDGDFFMPLHDDGDAFKLAVYMNMFNGSKMFHFRSIERFERPQSTELERTRRAIVRTAAEAGESMP